MTYFTGNTKKCWADAVAGYEWRAGCSPNQFGEVAVFPILRSAWSTWPSVPSGATSEKHLAITMRTLFVGIFFPRNCQMRPNLSFHDVIWIQHERFGLATQRDFGGLFLKQKRPLSGALAPAMAHYSNRTIVSAEAMSDGWTCRSAKRNCSGWWEPGRRCVVCSGLSRTRGAGAYLICVGPTQKPQRTLGGRGSLGITAFQPRRPVVAHAHSGGR